MTAAVLHELLDLAADVRPAAVAVGHGGAVMTFAEVAQASRRIAGWLTGRGVRRGDRVVIALPLAVELPALIYGCSRVGAAFSVVNEQAPAVFLAHVLDDAGPRLLLTDRSDVEHLAAERAVASAGLRELRQAAVGPDVRTAAATLAARPPLTVDPACLIYTSGSTGTPKAVVSTHAQMVFAATAIQSQLRYRDTDVVYVALPLSFDYGLYQVFLSTLGGSRVQLAASSTAGPQLYRELSLYRATVLPAVPPMASGLARMLMRPGATSLPLRLLTNTGAAMQPEVLRRLREVVPTLRVQLMFGLTECKRAAIMPEDEDLTRPGACGRALPGTEILIVDQDGEQLPAGEVGEIVVRGPNVMAGYWRRPELTAQRFPRHEGLFPQLRTGDYGWLDDDGFLYFAGRRDDLYKERGTRVSVAEVEAAAHRVDGVLAAAVLPPAPDEDGAILFVVSALSPSAVLTALRAELEDVKAPQVCVAVDAIPATRNGKVDRGQLVRLLEERSRVH